MKKKSLLVVLVAMLVSIVLAACGGSGEKSSDGDSNKGDSEGGGTLIFGRGGDSVSLDPITVTDGESFAVTQNIFETLIRFGEQDTTLQPGLAKEWKVSDDGLEYTFTLQEGVKFHDGTDFNADAVVKNFERWMTGDAEKFPYFQSMFGGFEGEDAAVIKEVKADSSCVDICE